jgi:hypothetical protein
LVEYVPSAAESAASAKAGIDWPVVAIYAAIALAALAVMIVIFLLVRNIIRRRSHATPLPTDETPRP